MKLNLFLLSAAALVNAATAIDEVFLGTAGDYVILAKDAISTVPQSVITGNIGVESAATLMTGFSLSMDSGGQYSTSTQVDGHCHAHSYGGGVLTALETAVTDMQTAYTDAASSDRVGTGCETAIPESGDISGLDLSPGLYTFDTDISITSGDITLTGSNTDIFILRTTGNLSLTMGTQVILDGVLASNIFWQVAGSVEVGESAVLEGIILVKTKAVFGKHATLNGRVLAQSACTLDMTTVNEPSQ